MFDIGENVRVLDSPFYSPLVRPYVGQTGAISRVNVVGQSVRCQVAFADGQRIWFFSGELADDLTPAQKRQHVRDLLSQYENGDYGLKTSLVKAGLAILLGDKENV